MNKKVKAIVDQIGQLAGRRRHRKAPAFRLQDGLTIGGLVQELRRYDPDTPVDGVMGDTFMGCRVQTLWGVPITGTTAGVCADALSTQVPLEASSSIDSVEYDRSGLLLLIPTERAINHMMGRYEG